MLESYCEDKQLSHVQHRSSDTVGRQVHAKASKCFHGHDETDGMASWSYIHATTYQTRTNDFIKQVRSRPCHRCANSLVWRVDVEHFAVPPRIRTNQSITTFNRTQDTRDEAPLAHGGPGYHSPHTQSLGFFLMAKTPSSNKPQAEINKKINPPSVNRWRHIFKTWIWQELLPQILQCTILCKNACGCAEDKEWGLASDEWYASAEGADDRTWQKDKALRT